MSNVLPTSSEVGKILSVLVREEGEMARKLSTLMKERFEDVMTHVQENAEIMGLIAKFLLIPSPSADDKKRLLTQIDTLLKTIGKIESKDEAVSAAVKKIDEKENFGNSLLQKNATAIQELYAHSEKHWYSPDSLPQMSGLCIDFLEHFLLFYSDTYEGNPNNRGGGVAVMDKKKKKEKGKWDSESDDEEKFICPGDATTLMLTFTIVQTYTEYLDRCICSLPQLADQQKFLEEQKVNNTWEHYDNIVRALKRFLFEKSILDATSEFEFSFEDNLTGMIQSWDSMAIQINRPIGG